jgi:hypothetical protein
MQYTRRRLFSLGGGALVTGATALTLFRKAKAQDFGNLNNCIDIMIGCWNEYGPHGNSFGVDWTLESDGMHAMSDAWSGMAYIAQTQGIDDTIATVVNAPDYVPPSQVTLIGSSTYLTNRGANLQSRDVESWTQGLDMSAGRDQLVTSGFSGTCNAIVALMADAASQPKQSRAAAVQDALCHNTAKLQSGVTLGAAILGGLCLFGCVFCCPAAAGGAVGIGIVSVYRSFALNC